MEDGQNNPIIDGPEPSRWAGLLSALKAAMARKPASAAPQAETAAPPAKTRRSNPPSDAADARIALAEREVHGPPAVWMAPFFLLFALAYAAPLIANSLAPAAPRGMIHGLVAVLPPVAGRIEPLLAGWLWAPWWVAVPALFMRIKAAWTTVSATLDAVGWGMGALTLEGAAWLFFGRKLVTTGFSPAEQDGAWQLLVLEFLFLLLTAITFGPTRRNHLVKP